MLTKLNEREIREMSQISKENERRSVWLLPKAVASLNLITSTLGQDSACDWKTGNSDKGASVTICDLVAQHEGHDTSKHLSTSCSQIWWPTASGIRGWAITMSNCLNENIAWVRYDQIVLDNSGSAEAEGYSNLSWWILKHTILHFLCLETMEWYLCWSMISLFGVLSCQNAAFHLTWLVQG